MSVCLYICFMIVPTMQKLGSFLEKVMDWEEFGYQLLPEDKEHLVQVHNVHIATTVI